MTENEKRKEGDDLMTCFVIHVSLLSLHIRITRKKKLTKNTHKKHSKNTIVKTFKI